MRLRLALVADHPESPPSGLPPHRLHEVLQEAIRVPTLYPALHFGRGERRYSNHALADRVRAYVRPLSLGTSDDVQYGYGFQD